MVPKIIFGFILSVVGIQKSAGSLGIHQFMNGGLNMEDEKRRFTRFTLNMNATLCVEGDSYDVDTISNLSIGGCLLPIHADLAPNTPCSVIIKLGITESDVSIKVEGIIIRCENGDVAVKFSAIDPDSLFHLQMLARYNSSDAEKVEEEIKKHPGIF